MSDSPRRVRLRRSFDDSDKEHITRREAKAIVDERLKKTERAIQELHNKIEDTDIVLGSVVQGINAIQSALLVMDTNRQSTRAMLLDLVQNLTEALSGTPNDEGGRDFINVGGLEHYSDADIELTESSESDDIVQNLSEDLDGAQGQLRRR